MTYFTTDNTEGQYTTEQLAALNARVQQLMSEGMRESNAMDQAAREMDDKHA